MTDASISDSLEPWYQESRLIGGIGSDSLEKLLEMASNYIDVVRGHLGSGNLSILDLGSGVGIPGLLMALLDDALFVTLVDGMAKRSALASRYSIEFALADRLIARNGRAEELGDVLGRFDCVVARCFGAPPILAEIASGFIRPGGILLASEPPTPTDAQGVDNTRWSLAGLSKLGFGVPTFVHLDFHFVVIPKLQDRVRGRAFRNIVKNPLW
ncbi:RsmG family class I SAM-dependent methyltransferase [Acidithrix ferrooxidans]|uniref:Glucose-inhibited division protein B n=2 Tax=root TaxID=1 RepID=A0A0D8HH50_9ACTN|nr:RsmG family class I SAM-dependent methyltransferase [Acidithrix ferrooxidans]KJF17179.1 ribosomal RNA small subunit methyltransferase G [Acidithrix ferrooxidans]